jgi:S-formylglutathione hydrolase FrmB
MKHGMFAGLFALATLQFAVPADAGHRRSLQRINACLHGTVVDFTRNHGCDHRMYSPALCEYRDLYVYLPPGYDPKQSYPLLIWLHSYTDDECEFAKKVVPAFDQAIASGELPPLIVAAPDGSLCGHFHWFALGSWYVNSRRGCFADFIADDVVSFVEQNFSICRDRSGRAIAGFSMGGFGAYSIGMQHTEKFKVVAGISPPLNMRYVGHDGRYRTDYEPDGIPLRDDFHSLEVIGEFYGGLMKVRAYMVVKPVWGRGRAAVERVSPDNPIELLDRLNTAAGTQDYYAAYPKTDELNIDAQVESFLDAAQQRNVAVESRVYPCGDHSVTFMLTVLSDLFAWMKPRLTCPASNDTTRSVVTGEIYPAEVSASAPSVTAIEAVLILPQPASR